MIIKIKGFEEIWDVITVNIAIIIAAGVGCIIDFIFNLDILSSDVLITVIVVCFLNWSAAGICKPVFEDEEENGKFRNILHRTITETDVTIEERIPERENIKPISDYTSDRFTMQYSH